MNNLNQLCETVLKELSKEGYTSWGVKKHQQTYKIFCSYADFKSVELFSDELMHMFLLERYNASVNTKRGMNTYTTNMRITHLLKLSHYTKFDNIHYYKTNGQKSSSLCPKCFIDIWDKYLNYLQEFNYAVSTCKARCYESLKFLQYLYNRNIHSLKEISFKIVSDYFFLFKNCSKYTLKGKATKLRVFFKYLNNYHGFTVDIINIVPKIHVSRNAFLPSYLKRNEIKKLIESIDTRSTVGKRDLALLLLAIQMGMRVSDIKALTLDDFNWREKTLKIIQQKTKKQIILPIPNDTGWAIIDYIKESRPETKDRHLFIRHSSELGSFSSKNTLKETLHKYMRKANIPYPNNEHRGFHCLRSSYATLLLSQKTPLPIIKDLLGHSSTLSSSYYMKIDVENLRFCAIDVDKEVLLNDKK